MNAEELEKLLAINKSNALMVKRLCRKMDRYVDSIAQAKEKELSPFCTKSEAATRIGLTNARFIKYYIDRGLIYSHGGNRFLKKDCDALRSKIEANLLILATYKDVYKKHKSS